MKRIIFLVFLLSIVFLSFSSSIAQPPSFYGYGDDDYREYQDDMRDYINSGGVIPTQSPAEIREQQRIKDKQFKSLSNLISLIFWGGLIFWAYSRVKNDKD